MVIHNNIEIRELENNLWERRDPFGDSKGWFYDLIKKQNDKQGVVGGLHHQ